MTNEEPPPGPLRRGLATGRLEAFSDGVFAIAITLLVLNIAVPASAGAHLLRSVADLWPSYLGYVVSVSTIGAMWLGHNAITDYLERTDVGFVRLNLLLLLVIAFLPFPTMLLAEFIGKDSPERVAVTIYGLSFLLASTLLLVLWRYAVRYRLVRPDAADEEVQLLTKRLNPGLAGYLVLIVRGCSSRSSRLSGTWASPCTTSSRFRAVPSASAACDDDRRSHDGRAAVHGPCCGTHRVRLGTPRLEASRSAWGCIRLRP